MPTAFFILFFSLNMILANHSKGTVVSCQQILGKQDLYSSEVESALLPQYHSPNLALSGEPTPAELRSSQVFIERFHGRGIFVGNLGSLARNKDVPLIDLIHLSSDDSQSINLSIKTKDLKHSSFDAIEYIKGLLLNDRRKFRKYYFRSVFMEFLGFPWSGRKFYSKKYIKDGQLTVDDALKIVETGLGLKNSEKRSFYLLVDLSGIKNLTPSLIGRAGIDDVYLSIIDENYSYTNYKKINLTRESDRIKSDFEESLPLKGVIVMFSDNTLIFGLEGIHLFSDVPKSFVL